MTTSVILLALPLCIRLDGKPHADWQQFFGRFHPLAVHVPIGLLVLLPILEIAGARRPALREAADLVLWLACLACLGSLLLGYLLAFGSGETGTLVNRHLWGATVLSVALIICLVVRPLWSEGVSSVYPLFLIVAVLAMVWTADQGGSITHGDRYLTQYMPARLRALFKVSSANVKTESIYTNRIDPIFGANCVTCHRAGKTKGGLRLDSYEQLMKGGSDGPVVVPGDPTHSLLFERITLPRDNTKAMPADGRAPLKPEEIALIQSWIDQGASATAGSVAGMSNRKEPDESPTWPVGDYSALTSEIAQMRAAQGPKLLPVSSNPSDGLILDTVDTANTFDDAALDRFEKYAPYIVEVDLARTAVTDKSFETLGKFSNLRSIHLEGTQVTGAGIAKLNQLSQLSYLNLSETKLSSSALPALKSLKSIRHAYTFDTPANPASNSASSP
ncbi:MAG TPA: c-type cytochrome domain-containing protein [Terracidiphilus sp.]|nr:c-type cytochrome domain-containing protein [Terracidiphilus sp.]